MTTKEKTIEIEVADEGIGIAVEKQHSLFQRFESLVKQNILQPSSGIGLSLVKEMVEMHHGTITVDSQPGVGSRFTVSLPLQREVFEEDVQVEFILNDSQSSTPHPVDSMKAPEEMEEKEDLENNSDGFSILVVEDNEELKAFLKNILSENYTVITASNGEEGLQHAVDDLPDLIISDVMMPRTDGFELCYRIKNDVAVSHIPVVLLTARVDQASSVEGYKSGADIYLAKPFDIDSLLVILRNILRQRDLLRVRYRESGCLFSPKEDATSNADEQFMCKLNTLLRENLSNPDLNVPFIASAMAMSRTTLYSKFSHLSDVSVGDYVIRFRMVEASRLLSSHKDMSIQEVADRVGFSSARYFSTAFKQSYGVTPTEYRRNN